MLCSTFIDCTNYWVLESVNTVRYAQRQPVERLFSRLKQFRRLATRYDKLDAHFLDFIHLAATILWLRDC